MTSNSEVLQQQVGNGTGRWLMRSKHWDSLRWCCACMTMRSRCAACELGDRQDECVCLQPLLYVQRSTNQTAHSRTRLDNATSVERDESRWEITQSSSTSCSSPRTPKLKSDGSSRLEFPQSGVRRLVLILINSLSSLRRASVTKGSKNGIKMYSMFTQFHISS